MRIIGGTARGRRLQAPGKSAAHQSSAPSIRPTADRAREALFSIIGREIENATVLDLFAGTGALGLEALSRGAARAVFVDHNPQAIRIIKRNIALCGFADQTLVFKRDLSRGLSFLTRQLPGGEFSMVFADPPYRQGLSGAILHELSAAGILLPETLVVLEEDGSTEPIPRVADLGLVDQRRYGDTGFFLYRQVKQLPQDS